VTANPAALGSLTQDFLLLSNKPQSLGFPPVFSELLVSLCVWGGVLGFGHKELSLLLYLKDSQRAPEVHSQWMLHF